MKRISIFLIVVTLIVGIVGCDDSSNDGIVDEHFTLTVENTSGGLVTVNNVTIYEKSIFTYDAGTIVSLNTTPDSSYQFVRWTGDIYTIGNSRASETIITMNGDYSITAVFEIPPPVQYMLNVIGPAHGEVTTPGEGRFFLYEEGTVVNLVAEPDSGYEFARWTGDVDTIANVNAASTTIIMNGEYYITAYFKEKPIVCY